MEQFKNEEFNKADLTRDIHGLSFAEVCKACMTQDKKAKVKLVLKTGKGTVKVKERSAIEWINLGSSKTALMTKHICIIADSPVATLASGHNK
jgi:hypothetical protein